MITGEPAGQGYTTGMVCRQVAATHHPHESRKVWPILVHCLVPSCDLVPSILLHSAMFHCLHLQEGHVLQIWKLQRSRLGDEKLQRIEAALGGDRVVGC